MRKIKGKFGKGVIGIATILLMMGLLTGTHVAAQKVTVSFYSWMAAEVVAGGISVLEDAEKRFEKLNPGVDIKTVPLPYEETADQLTLMTAAGNPPDITTIDVVWLAPLVYMGGLQPLDEFITPSFKSDMIEAAYKDGLLKGKLYALTWNPNPNALFYNKDLLKRAGFTRPPTNMKEFDEQIAAISALGPDIYGTVIQSDLSTLAADYFHTWLWNFGGELVDEEGKVVVNKKGAVDALTWFKGVTDKKYSPKGQYIRDIRVLFSQRKAGFIIEGPWIAGILRGEGMKDEEWDLSTIPGSPIAGPLGYTQPAHHMLAMSKQCKNKEWAWKYMEFMVSDPQVTKVYFQNTGLMPVLGSAYVDEVYATKFVRTFFEQMKAMKKPSIWNSPRYAEAERFFMVAVQKATMKGVDPQKALDEVAESLKILLGG